jgi:hypothetical protein
VVKMALSKTFCCIAGVLSDAATLEAPIVGQGDAAVQSRPPVILANQLFCEAQTTASEKYATQGQEFIARMRKESDATLQRRIERKELVTAGELTSALQVPSCWVRDAVVARRLFAVVGPSGEAYYPAFYADPRYGRHALEKVSQRLGDLPGALKYPFFTRLSYFLGSKPPLDALAEGRLADVLKMASAYAER